MSFPTRRLTTSRQRLTTDLTAAVPTSQFTPGQRFFRDSIGEGRWQAEPDFNVHPAARITMHGDNTCDMVMLDADADGWLDLGGPPIRDVTVGRL